MPNTHIPKTAAEARRRRFEVVATVDPEKLSAKALSRGMMIKPTEEPDPLAWCGPCEPNGFRRCCYVDDQGMWVCHSVPCHFSLATE